MPVNARLRKMRTFDLLLFAGIVYNLTLELTNTAYDDSLSTSHAAEFIALSTDFEVGVS